MSLLTLIHFCEDETAEDLYKLSKQEGVRPRVAQGVHLFIFMFLE